MNDSSEPAVVTPPKVAPKPRSRTRGYIDDFGQGRVCGAPDCETLLSRYNQGRFCWAHDDSTKAPRRGSAR